MINSQGIITTTNKLMQVYGITRSHTNQVSVQNQLKLGIGSIKNSMSQADQQKAHKLAFPEAQRDSEKYNSFRVDFRAELTSLIVDVYYFNKQLTDSQRKLLIDNGIVV